MKKMRLERKKLKKIRLKRSTEEIEIEEEET